MSYLSRSSEQRNFHLYNGKELQPDFDIDWYDYGARFYDPQLGRWHVPDPMAEARNWLSSYQYTQNTPINRIDPTGDLDTKYEDEVTRELIEDLDDGIDQTVKVNKEQYTYMKNKASWIGLNISKKTDAFLFSMLYERWSEVPGTSIKFNVFKEDPNFNSEKKDNFYISHMDVNKTTQKITLSFTGEAPVDLPITSEISTGASDKLSPNGNYTVWWRSTNKSSNMSLNTYKDAVFAVKYGSGFKPNIATHYYNCPGYPASHGCTRIKTRWFAGMIWTFSKEQTTTVKVHGIWPGHVKK